LHLIFAMTSCSLYAMSLLCIIIGGVRSSNFVKRQMSKKQLIEASISVAEAKKFPFMASIVLFTLYIFFKYGVIFLIIYSIPESAKTYLEYVPSVTKDHIIKLLLVLICWEGCVALAALLKPMFSSFLSLLPIGNRRPRLNLPYFLSLRQGMKEMDEGDIMEANKKDFKYLFKLEIDTHDIVAISVCLLVGVSHLFRRHWITNNIIGIAFSIYGIENLHLSSFKAGSLLLAGLFIYDIFWVFATDVMTSVAKGIDAPILLLFPLDILRHGWQDANKHSMLGLGDIVIPGIFIALLRRFDHRIGEKDAKKQGRYFFSITVMAYALGLLITMLVMHHFKAAQPALLYLVPCCLLIPLSVSLCTGEAQVCLFAFKKMPFQKLLFKFLIYYVFREYVINLYYRE
uniref:Signal peptide peptidase n=1 Tax=Angiostrongylus cantonensis TaxID=6313 RepID=A0A0K0CZI6_ANGCA